MNDLKENLGIVLPVLASAGVIFTSALAVKATPKAIKLIEEDSKKNHDGDPHAYTKKEAFKSAWKCYIPAVFVGAATIACIASTSVVNKKTQDSLASAYILLRESYDKYEHKVKEIYGEEAHEKIIEAIVKDERKDIYIHSAGLTKSIGTDFSNDEEPEPIHTFYDRFSNRYFDATVSDVLQAEYHLNRNFALNGGYITLNEFYDFLGLKPTIAGDVIGWSCEHDICWIDFDHSVANIDDGSEEGGQIYVIDMIFTPEPFDEDYN